MRKSSLLDLIFRRYVLQLLCRLRIWRLGVYVLDASVCWTGLSYRSLFFKYLVRGKLLLQLHDLIDWNWVVHHRDDHESGFEIIDSVVYGKCDTFQLLPWELESVDREDLKRVEVHYRAKFYECFNTLKFLNSKLKLVKVIYGQGYTTGSDACRQFSLRNNIDRFAIENVANKDRVLWDDISGIAVNKTLAKNFYYGYRDVVEREVVLEYAIRKRENIRSMKLDEHTSGDASCDGEGYILFLGQVFTDTSIIFSVKQGWGPIEVLESLASILASRGRALRVKLHPKEHQGVSSLARIPYDCLTYNKMKQVAGLIQQCEQVDYKNETDTYDMIAKASVVVTMNSQAGLEAALFGKPVICCAPSNYSGLGFTFDCFDSYNFESVLDHALACAGEDLEERAIAASTFDYIFNEIYCIEKNLGSFVRKTMKR